jgi:thiol-disulfide isomerase/thioredoxin
VSRYAVFVLCFTATAGTAVAQTVDVRLHEVRSRLGDTRGMTNVFFTASTSMSMPPGWDSTGVAELTRVGGTEIHLARGWTGHGWAYRCDSDGDGSVRDEESLRFIDAGELRAAAVDIELGAARGAILHFHVLTAEDYVYARPAQAWHGQLRIGDRAVPVAVRPLSRMDPIPTVDAPFEMLVDLDGDGELRERSQLTPAGRVAPSEVVRPDQPFRVGEQAFHVESLDIGSLSLRVTPVQDTVAATPGFLAPGLRTTTLDDRPVSLENLRGEVVVVEFWSIHCPFSEQVRPEIASLKERYPRVRWVAIAREVEAEAVRAHLTNHPMAGDPWMNRPDIWKRWNPRTLTPLFYVIDGQGRIVAIEPGAGAVGPLDGWLETLLP